MLLHGPPGTGKTLTAMYLAGQMRERTTFLLTGQGLGSIEESCQMARMLQPATLIIEDVDLVAEERTRQGVCENSLLFELLNQMDGLSEDSDVLFLLTTNRPELLEPALASRPGRVDLAVEVPLPDLACRQRLVALYGKGLRFGRDVDLVALAKRTEGVSGAFIKELLRKSALFAADAGTGVVRADHVDAALHELTILGGELTRSILGGPSAPAKA
jgi:ATP-dependent 26S proteasome regulatory subunit